MEENKFYTGGIVKQDTIEEINNFIRQTDGCRMSQEQYDKIIEIIKNSQLENVEIPTIQL